MTKNSPNPNIFEVTEIAGLALQIGEHLTNIKTTNSGQRQAKAEMLYRLKVFQEKYLHKLRRAFE